MRFSPLIVALALPLAACGKTFEWNEEVTLASGEIVRVARMESRGDLPASLPGGQSMRSQSLAFDHRGKRVTWKADTGSWPMYIGPRAFEMVNGEPVLIFDVHAYEACSRFDFPQDAIGALRYRDGAWSLMPRAEIPAGLKVNLLHAGAYALGRNPEYKGMLVDDGVRKKLEAMYQAPRSGATLEELSRYNALPMFDHSACRILRRAANPALDAATERLDEAQRAAPLVQATAGPMDESRREIPKRGSMADEHWTGRVWLASNCNGVVERVEPIAQTSGDGRSHTARYDGVAFLLADKSVNAGRAELQAGALAIQRVSCEAGNIAILMRRDKSSLVLLRLKPDGTLRDATRISLPEAERMGPGGLWAELWKIEMGEKALELAIGEFVENPSSDKTRTLVRSRAYSVALQP